MWSFCTRRWCVHCADGQSECHRLLCVSGKGNLPKILWQNWNFWFQTHDSAWVGDSARLGVLVFSNTESLKALNFPQFLQPYNRSVPPQSYWNLVTIEYLQVPCEGFSFLSDRSRASRMCDRPEAAARAAPACNRIYIYTHVANFSRGAGH